MSARTLSHIFTYLFAAAGAAAMLPAPLSRAYPALIVGAGMIGAVWDRRGTHFIPRMLLTAVGLGGFFFSLLPFRKETLAEQSLAALAFLLAVKLLEAKKRRDHLQVMALAVILTAGSGSLAPELSFGPLILVECLLGTAFLTWLPFAEHWGGAPVGRKNLSRLGLFATAMVVTALPLALLLFVILPRTINPFWGGLAARQKGISGFSDSLQLGQVGELALSGETAFRAEMEIPRGVLPQTPYWRGIIMEKTDGRNWSALPPRRSSRGRNAAPTTRVTYYVEPHGQKQLFLLEQPLSAVLGFRPVNLKAGGILSLNRLLLERIRYRGMSLPGESLPADPGEEGRSLNLQLPEDLSPRIRNLAAEIIGEENDSAIAARLLNDHFAKDFSYSLQVPPAESDPLEAFLFSHRTGYCEYFASALTIMLRSAGIPARLVAGYLGGEFNENGNYYLVTQSDAHTWVEAHLGGSWVRFDPTPTAGLLGGTYASRRVPRPMLWLDTLRMRWNSRVVQYDTQEQLRFFRESTRQLGQLKSLGTPGVGMLILAAFLTGAVLFLARRGLRPENSSDPLLRRYDLFNRLMSRKGIARKPFEGPLDYGSRIAAVWPDSEEAAEFVRLYTLLRYGGSKGTESGLKRLDLLLGSIPRRGKRES